jgi:hypothetical protein
MPTWLVLLVATAVLLLVVAGTEAGQRARRHLHLPTLKGRAPRKDREYLLRVCSGDRDRVARLLELAHQHNPDMSEAEAYRRAIRSYLRDRG